MINSSATARDITGDNCARGQTVTTPDRCSHGSVCLRVPEISVTGKGKWVWDGAPCRNPSPWGITPGGGNMCSSLPSGRRLLSWRDISVLSRAISMQLAINIHHASWKFLKRFSKSEVKGHGNSGARYTFLAEE